MYIVEGMGSVRKDDIPLGKAFIHHLAQGLGRGNGEEISLVLFRSKHPCDDALHFLVALATVGRLLRVLSREDDLHALLPCLLNLLQVTQRDDLHARKQDDREVLMVDIIVHIELAVGCAAAVVEHLWMQIGEVNAEVVCQVMRNLRIIRTLHIDAAFVVTLWPVEPVPGI